MPTPGRKTAAYSGGTLLVLVLPLHVVLGQNFAWLNSFTTEIGNFFKLAVPVLVVFALAAFIWGVIRFMRETSDEKRAEARTQMLWGLVGLFVIVTVWGLVFLLSVVTGIFAPASPVAPPQSLFP